MLTLRTYFKKPSLIFHGFIKRFFRLIEPLMSDNAFIRMIYPYYIGEKLDLQNPKAFNAKLQWLKLYYYDPRFTMMVDKANVKTFVAETIGQEYVIPTIGIWENFDDIDFEKLPNSFVIKTTHGGGGNGVIVCKDKSKLNIPAARKRLNKNLKEDISVYYKEWPYKKVQRRIIVEELISTSGSIELMDYKLLCFNGKVRCSFVGSNRFGEGGVHTTYYDRDWNRLPFERSNPSEKSGIPKPTRYEEMVRIAEILSKDIPFVRVDFYEADDHIYFGEMTFFPGSGFLAFKPKVWDERLGDWLTLPSKNRG